MFLRYLREKVTKARSKRIESPGQTGRKLGANDTKARSKRYESSVQTGRMPKANYKAVGRAPTALIHL